MQPSLVRFLLCAALALGLAQAAVHEIKPTLNPTSDKHFFGPPFPADYPDDGRPAVGISKHFDHPYPIVQDSSSYDKDFVKDENADSGEWAVQFRYDKLRGQLRMKRKAVDAAGKHKSEEDQAYSKVKVEAQNAQAKFNKTEEEKTAAQKKFVDEEWEKTEAENAEKKAAAEADEASKAADEANKQAEAAAALDEEGAASKDVDESKMPMASKIKAARQNVEDKIKHLEGCKQQLEDAKNELKEIYAKQKQQEQEAIENGKKIAEKDKKAAAEQQARSEAALKDAQAATSSASEDLAEAEKAANADKEELDKAKVKMEEENRKRKRVTAKYQEEAHDLEVTEAQLKAAEAKVKAMRNQVSTDINKGVYRKTTTLPVKAAAPRIAASWSLTALAVAASLAAMQ